MKLLLLAALVAVAVAAPAKLDKEPVAILRQSKDFRPDGSINFGFESADGIKRDETISNKQITPEASGVVARGSYSYTGDDGKVYTVTWVADENGFQPSGAHLPVA